MVRVWRIIVFLVFSLICLGVLLATNDLVAKARSSLSVRADPAWCDEDEDGFCLIPFGQDCDDADASTYPGAEERADLKDNNCSGFEDEPPLGFDRLGYTMGGAASAVTWYQDYVFLAAMATLRVYHVPDGAVPQLLNEFELRDWVREMVVDGDTLFVAARGDGLYAYDLSQDPARPQPAGRISGFLQVGEYSAVPAIFNGVAARNGRVALALVNNVTRDQGGVDALVYDYDPMQETFILAATIETDVRGKVEKEAPISVGLSADGAGLYLGYGILVGELVYVPLKEAGGQAMQLDVGAPFDIAVHGDWVYLALSGLVSASEPFGMLSRARWISETLQVESIVSHDGSGAGISVDTHGDLLCFGTWSPGRYEEGYNLWAYRDLDGPAPVRVGAAGTLDWIYQLACRDSGDGRGWAYVADEWGGLELWASDGISLSLDLENHRLPSGALSTDLFSDGQRLYSAKEGAGLWVFEETDLPHAEVAVEWIDRNDPGCACQGCCPPQEGSWPYPPAIFNDVGLVNQGRVMLLGHDRNTAVAGDSYFMVFQETDGEYELIYSDPIAPADPIFGTWGANMMRDHGEIIFTSIATGDLQLYQHCPEEQPAVRWLGEIESPSTESGLEFGDAAVYGDYLFLTERHRIPLAEPDRGLVHVLRWKSGPLATCPDTPDLSLPPEYLGSFGEGKIPYRLLVDLETERLYVGFTSKRTWPIIEGGLYAYDLTAFDPGDVAAMDDYSMDLTAANPMRVTYANVHEFLLDGEVLYITDRDNGLYRYALSQGRYTGFYPAHRGPNSEAYTPREVVQSPEGVVPLYHPVALVITPSGRLAVQELVTGRVSLFSMERWLYLPLVGR